MANWIVAWTISAGAMFGRTWSKAIDKGAPPGGAGGERIFAPEHAVGGRAGQLGDDRHVVDADRDDRIDDAGSVGRGQHDRRQKRGKGEDEVAGLHDRVLDESLRERRDEAERDAEHEADADRDDADQDRDPRTRQQLRGDVAPEAVGPEPMRQRGRRELVRDVDRGGRIGRPDERDRRRGEQSGHEDGAQPEADVRRANRGLMRPGS